MEIRHQLRGLGIRLLGLSHNEKIGAFSLEGLKDGFGL